MIDATVDSARRARSPVVAAAVSVWALLFGLLLLMLGNGLQGTLIGVRATVEGFGTNATGLVMAGYFAGFLAGSSLAPRFIRRVGHLRVFAALAALASVAILVQSVFISPVPWGAMRVVIGFSFAGIYVATESWLNDRVTNEHRGGLLSIYMVISYAGLGGGQLLLNAAEPSGFVLFVLVSMLISLASVPILLTVTAEPRSQAHQAVGVRTLHRLAPLGTTGCLAAGVATGALLGMGPVYATRIGMSVAEVSVFMAVLIGAGALVQWPIGKLSDRVDRHRVILATAVVGAGGAAIAWAVQDVSLFAVIASGALMGAAMLTLYSLSAAHMNDSLSPFQMVGASSRLVMIYGAGAVVAPPLAGWSMGLFGPGGFLALLLLALAGLAAHALVRERREGRARARTPYVNMPGRTPSLSPAWVEVVRTVEPEGGEPE